MVSINTTPPQPKDPFDSIIEQFTEIIGTIEDPVLLDVFAAQLANLSESVQGIANNIRELQALGE